MRPLTKSPERMDAMNTKLPPNGKQVATSGLRRKSRRRARGIALISVIAVLVLLTMVATPFMLAMNDSAARGEKFLYGQRADAEAESLFDTVRAQLVGCMEHVERRKLDAGTAMGAGGAAQPPGDATPDYDVADEFAMPQSVLDRFNQANAKEHRVWAADIVDTQTLFNLNNCSYPVLANILGRAEVSAATTADKLTITLTHVPESFPKADGVVRIGSECVHYRTIIGNDLVNCERGYLQAQPGNGPAHDLEMGDAVIPESCFQIATRPFRLRPPAWVRYTHVDQARTISDMGVAPLTPEDFEVLRPYITAWNGNAVGDGWCNPQKVKNGLSAHDKQNLYVKLKNVSYFGPGTMVQITDGVNYDYAVVSKIRGTDEVVLAGDIAHDYQADQTRIYCLARSPINVNTADVATLALCFDGLHIRGRNASISRRQAEDLAAFLKTWKMKPVAGTTNNSAASNSNGDAPPAPTPNPAPGVFRDWEDFTRAIEDAKNAGKLDDDGVECVLRNAMNANDARLGFSTVPFVFRSNDIYEVRATVSIQGAQGHEMARRELRRVMEVSTTKSGTFVLESQSEIQSQIMKSRDAKYMMTYPVNVARFDDKNKLNIPPSEFLSFHPNDLFPSTDRTVGVGNVQLAPASFRFGTTNNRVDHVVHFDNERIPDGFDIKDKPYSMSVDSPYAPQANPPTLDLVDKVDIPSFADGIELGLREFACSFWYRPEWDRGGADQYVFDYGLDTDDMDRVSLRYDHLEDSLVLAVSDATRERRSCEVRYNFDHGTWVSKQWYHIACHVHGCSPEMMELFIDGEQQGKSSVETRLTGSVSPIAGSATGTFDLQVEDCKHFPAQGVVIVRGKEGVELMEYSSHGDNALTISRRKARTIPHAPTDTIPRTHNPGDTVQLYGYTAPLVSDIQKGGSTLVGSLGAWRCYRFHCTNDTIAVTNNATPPQSIPVSRGLCNPKTASTSPPTVSLTDWDTDSTDATILNDLGAAGTEGIALICSALYKFAGTATLAGNPNPPTTSGAAAGDQQSSDIGGYEFVRYVVSTTPGSVQITGRNLQLRHIGTKDGSDNQKRFIPTYSYGDTANEPIGTAQLDNTFLGDTANKGAMTAFIPIAVVGTANGNPKYLDPQDAEPQLKYKSITINSQPVDLSKAYLQIDGEWIQYDTFDLNQAGSTAASGHVAFYRDMLLGIMYQLGGNNILPFMNSNSTWVPFTATSAQSYGVAGGSGGNASNDEPPFATDKNNESDAPHDPVAQGTPAGLPPPVSSLQIAQAIEFRGYENRTRQWEYRIANTIPPSPSKLHALGAQIVPAFCVTTGNCVEQAGINAGTDDGARYAAPGFNDLITIRDRNGNDDQLRLQWGYLEHGAFGYKAWCAATSTPVQTWGWDRPQTLDGVNSMRRWDSRAFTRIIKFPSTELPDGALTKAKPDFFFGKKYDGTGAVSQGTIDEVYFQSNFKRAPKDRPDYAYLGVVPQAVSDPVAAAQAQSSGNTGNNASNLPSFVGIDETTDEIDVHMMFLDDAQLFHNTGLAIDANTYADDGGVLKIDEELILYQQFDTSSGKFTGCKRGAFGTTPKAHEYEAIVTPIWSFPCSILTAGIDVTSGDYELKNASDFPDDGYLRIGLGSEIIGYTDWDVNNHLAAPLGRIDPTTAQRDPTGKQVGGAIFRGRFGTVPAAFNQGEVAIAMPFRVYDRYAEHADDPEQSYLGLSWTKHGAIFKRITWDAEPKQNVQVVALIRFSGGPAWDADKIIHVGQDQIPAEDRRKWLYQITDPKAENLLNVESDRIEVRLGVRYDKGAYDRTAQIAPDSWKESPQIRKVVVEFVAPPQVLTQE